MKSCYFLIWLYLLSSLSPVFSTIEPSIKECIQAAARMARTGNGSTPSSCMSCDPTHKECQPKCQNKVNYLYYACDGICLPDGYFFDPPQYLDGCWKDVKLRVKYAVERCGCNSASQIGFNKLAFLFSTLLLCLFLIL